ncbi:serine-rich adhesin for platelets isoform X2 [Pseudorasbora parva]|uniref:serine-rich adhesin for platelets isoform X2 n=1 Tax=Pseudorasbora parva TaxID=51549 RepID=UPI00351E1F9C
MRANVCVRHNMDLKEDAANVNNTPAEAPCQQHGQNVLCSEAGRPYADPGNSGTPFSNTQDLSVQPLIDRSETLKLEFQDSQMSPALTLLPCLDKSHLLSDSTFFQHTDAEFVPLRGFPDLSVVSERSPRISHETLTDASHLQHTIYEQSTLSQHPLEVPAALSEGEKSCCSLSQHSLSPGDHCKGLEDQWSISYVSVDKINRHMEGEEQTTAQQLSEGTSARLLLDYRKEDVVVAVSSSSAVSSASNTQNTDKSQLDHSMNLLKGREQPQGGSLSSSSSFQKAAVSVIGSDVSNITFRESQMHSYQSTDHLQDQLLSEGQRGSISAPAIKHHSGNKSGLCVTPAGEGVMHVPGFQRVLWSSGHLTATDGSFLSSQPVSQSTPAVPLMRPPPALTKLSLIHSKQEAIALVAASAQNSHSKTGLMPSLDLSDQHSSPIYSETKATAFVGPSETSQIMSHVHPVSNEQAPLPVLNPPASDTLLSITKPFYSGTKMKDQVSCYPLGRVQSLPSLSYLQKVDAWKANQSSSRSFYDNLDLQGSDVVSPKKKTQDTVSEALKHMLSRDTHQAFCANASSQVIQPRSSSHSGSGSPRRVDVVGAGACRGQASDSPVNRSHSHSSLSSVVTSIQRDTGTHSQQVPAAQSDDIIPATRSLDSQPSVLSGGRGEGGNNSAPHMDKSSIKMSPFLTLGRFSDVSSSLNMSSTLSSSQGSCHGERSMRASVGAASSVVSLEVDNYAPYWTSRPASPPYTKELNIEDRIPMYLLNLGIDQSPSTILNPFTRRGPIREPEFSPTDLCTIKGSIGTPTKSTQPSEVDSLQKETFSSSSQLSADSSASVTHHQSVHEQSQPASDRSVKLIFTEADTQPLHSTLHLSSSLLQSEVPQSEGSGLPIQLSPESVPPPGPREMVKNDDDSLVGSGTLHEIRRLLGRAESLVSGRSSLSSSPGSHRLSESDTSLVLGRNTQGYHDDTSLSTGGNLSLLLTRSSSDSALKGSLSSSQGPQQTDRTIEPAALSLSREESLKSRDLCVTPRRAEPEGCSAADPDKAKPSTATSVMQINVPSIPGNLQQSQDKTEDVAIGSSENSSSHVSAEVGSLSDSGSESSLAARVAKLLKSESPVSMVTSRPSTADPEESRAREWILMKVSGRRCESLELNAEDRERIEDIKRELLLNTKYTKWSSDSEGSAQSSVGPGSQQTTSFVGLRNMENHISDQLQKAGLKPLDTIPIYMPLQQDPGAKVQQITKATDHHTPSPQSLPNFPITGSAELDDVGPEYETLERDIHYRGVDAKVGTQLRHQPVIKPNVSGRKKETEREGQHIEEEKREEMTDDKENTVTNDSKSVQRMPQLDYTVTGSNQILSSAASVSTFGYNSHLSHMHVTLSPKRASSRVKYHSSRLSSQNASKDVPLQRYSLKVSSMTDKHLQSIRQISTSNHASSYEHREPVQGQNAGTANVHLQARCPQTFVPAQRMAGTSRTLSVQAATVPALLPYKPHGSSELFYVPQADAELSPGRSDTTVESSHPGSDDAVPPHFNIDVLGSRELEDNIITPKHKEGIYSKRANMNRVSSVSGIADQNDRTAPEVSYVSKKNMDTVSINEQYKDEEENFVPLQMEADYSTDDVHLHSSSMQEPRLPLEPLHLPSQPIRKSYRGNKKGLDRRTPHDVNMEISSSLDQLWRRFSEKWSMEETRLTNEGEISLLDRLERLSRLINNTTPTDQSILQPDSRNGNYDRRSDRVDETTEGEEQRERVHFEAAPQHAWPEREECQEKVHRCPAERDESASVSMETSSSLSTVDTERLLRAFGPHRITSKGLKSSDSLLKLYNTINMQKTGRRKPSTKHVSVATNDVSTDDSTVSADSLSSSSTIPHHSLRGVSHSLNSKRSKVKLLSKGVQAGDLEIVINATRRHTRDVGTIFPSPGAFNNSPNTFDRGNPSGIHIPTASTAKPTQGQTALKRDTGNKSGRAHYPNGVSWFVSADELKCDGRKENQPQRESVPSLSQAWFEPYSKIRPWREPSREPLRERQNQQEHERPTESRTAPETDISNKPAALVRISLQEALALHRPEFVSRSRERMKRLGLLVEERRLQAVFSREREELFNCPGPSRPLRPVPVPRRRVVPRREMVQRSKEKYAQLPEVQKRKEEERRRAEYCSYRLNAQLFNKKVTNRVLGKRAPWQ